MQIKHSKEGIELSDKLKKVLLRGSEIVVGDLVINETGEYETDQVAVIYSLNGALVCFDGLQVVYVTKLEKPNKFEEEEFSSADIAIFDEINGQNKDHVTSIIDTYDPKAVVFANLADAGELKGIQVEATPVVKITKLNLSEEGRDFYALAAS